MILYKVPKVMSVVLLSGFFILYYLVMESIIIIIQANSALIKAMVYNFLMGS